MLERVEIAFETYGDLAADALDLDFGLRLPGVEIEPASGPAHRLRCLEALATC